MTSMPLTPAGSAFPLEASAADGAVRWPKGDLRRMLAVLVAIERSSQGEGASLLEVSRQTGLDKRTITHQLEAASTQAGVTLHKIGVRWRIHSWGPMLHREGVMASLEPILAPPQTSFTNGEHP